MQPDSAIYRARRERILEQMGEGVMVIATAPEVPRNRDTHYPYRHDSYFYWLTGFNEPEAVVVLVGGKAPRHILFCRERKDETREIWDGFRYGPAAAREVFAFDDAFSLRCAGCEAARTAGNRRAGLHHRPRHGWDAQ